MSSPLILTDRTAIMPPQFCGGIDYYAIMSAYPRIVIDRKMRYEKRMKSTHRHTIADTRGSLTLTVPVEKPVKTTGATWNDIDVSLHGDWWNVHRTSLESAYGRTPYFEFYIDRFLQFYSGWGKPGRDMSLMNLDCGIDKVIRDILGIDSDVSYDSTAIVDASATDDYRHSQPAMPIVPYYQVRSGQLGFIAGLSILDLIFNMGPESPMILRQMTSGFNP